MSTEVALFGRPTGLKGYSWKDLSIEFCYPELGPVPENSWIVIRNLPCKFSTDDVLVLVNPYGYLEMIKINNKRNKTCAFVRMTSVDECARAIDGLDTTVFKGRLLRVVLFNQLFLIGNLLKPWLNGKYKESDMERNS